MTNTINPSKINLINGINSLLHFNYFSFFIKMEGKEMQNKP